MAIFIDAMISLVTAFVGFVLFLLANPEAIGDTTKPVIQGNGAQLLATLFGLALIIMALWYIFVKDGLGSGQSWGKRAMDLMVVDIKTNKPCTKSKSLARNLAMTGLQAIPYIGWLIEPIAVLADDDGKRLGDKATGVMVVETSEYLTFRTHYLFF